MDIMKRKIYIISLLLAAMVAVTLLICCLRPEQNEAAKTDVLMWFDDIQVPDGLEDGREIEVDAFPDVVFRCTEGTMQAAGELLYQGNPIVSCYFCDLNGDSFPELCSTVCFGFGIIDSRILVYDYANGMQYELSDRGNYDFILLQDEKGQLCVQKSDHATKAQISVTPLMIENLVGVIEPEFEVNFAGNISLQTSMQLSSAVPYWCIFVTNEGECNINVEIAGTVYSVPAGATERIFSDDLWEHAQYKVSFSSAGATGMVGHTECYRYKFKLEILEKQQDPVQCTTYIVLSNDYTIGLDEIRGTCSLSDNLFNPSIATVIGRVLGE